MKLLGLPSCSLSVQVINCINVDHSGITMAVIGVDLGGTKISSALSSGGDQFSCYDKVYPNKAKGDIPRN